jgi:ketosteroid isomerase-like protein
MERTEHPNAVAYRHTADAFRSGDDGLLASLIDADVVWHVPGAHAMAGDIHGRGALFDVQTRVVSVFHYRDGRQVERWFYPEDAGAWNAIFAD